MSRRIATLWDNKDKDSSDDSQQAFYAGGSERSGQQILGPNRDSREPSFVEDLVSIAQQSAIREAELSRNDPSSSRTDSDPSNHLPIRLYRNGFTIGDEELLHSYTAPQSQQFLSAIKRGETPPELAHKMKNGVIDIKLERLMEKDWEPKKTVTPFSGQGHRLGAPTPKVVENQDKP